MTRYDDKYLVFSSLDASLADRRRRHSDHVRRRLLPHLARALEERSFLDRERGCRQIREHPGLRVKLDPLGRDDVSPQSAVDRESLDVDLRFDVGVLADDELAPRTDLPSNFPSMRNPSSNLRSPLRWLPRSRNPFNVASSVFPFMTPSFLVRSAQIP